MMKKTTAFAVAVLTAFILSGCMYDGGGRGYKGQHHKKRQTAFEKYGARGQLTPGEVYTVRPGDTLFAISWRYGLDVDDLAQWNNIQNRNHIYTGQRLRTTPPLGTPLPAPVKVPKITSKGDSGWVWPTRGKIVQYYSKDGLNGQGIRFSGTRGQPVYAASSGVVAFIGDSIPGVGRLVLIEHGSGKNRAVSGYGYLENIIVSLNQPVRRGEQIASMSIGLTGEPTLLFRINKGNTSVNPLRYIGTTPRY